MDSVTETRRPASENGPMTPARTGRSVMRVRASRMASIYSAVRPAPTLGTASAFACSMRSSSTDRSIRLTAAADGTRSATCFMPCACMWLSDMRSRTVQPMSWMDGKERMGRGFLADVVKSDAIHCSMFVLFMFAPP